MGRKKKFCCAFLQNADVDSAHVSLFEERNNTFPFIKICSCLTFFLNGDCDFSGICEKKGRVAGYLCRYHVVGKS